MLSTNKRYERELRDAAREARTLLRAARRELGEGSERIREWLDVIGKNLFVTGFNVNAMKEALGVRNNSEAIFFHIAVGMPPGAFLEQLRLAAAAALLRNTTIPIGQVAELVGYSGMPTFSRAFARVHGLRPRAFRKKGPGHPEG